MMTVIELLVGFIAGFIVGVIGLFVFLEHISRVVGDPTIRAHNYERDQEEYHETLKARNEEK